MNEIAAQLRMIQLFYHQAHHQAKGVSFFADHKMLEKFYNQTEDHYDAVAERTVMLFGGDNLNLAHIVQELLHKFSILPPLDQLSSDKDIFNIALGLEKELCGRCAAQIGAHITEGTKQLLGDVCNASEVRQYKIQQRIS